MSTATGRTGAKTSLGTFGRVAPKPKVIVTHRIWMNQRKKALSLLPPNVVPTPATPIEAHFRRLLVQSLDFPKLTSPKRTTKTLELTSVAVCDPTKRAPVVPHEPETSQKRDLERLLAGLVTAKRREARPLFVISTRNRQCVNQKCYLGRLISSRQRARVPLYRLNRGDHTTIMPRSPKEDVPLLERTCGDKFTLLDPAHCQLRSAQRGFGERRRRRLNRSVALGSEGPKTLDLDLSK